MKERPIPFSGPMVRAILEGRKNQTRRVMKGVPSDEELIFTAWEGSLASFESDEHCKVVCPYGKPGDRLWVRETWATHDALYWSVMDGQDQHNIWYLAEGSKPGWVGKTRSSMFMPRWASRILLEITEVRVQRLQELSREDVFAEGLVYADLWESINGASSWTANPWVWAITFKQVQP